MGAQPIVVPAIPERCRNKTFGASDIKWVKTVNDRKTNSAYIPPDEPYHRVITNPEGVFFCLQLNPRFTDSLNRVRFGDLILLYQKVNKQTVKCFTHLVTPIGAEVIPSPYPPALSGWPGRWVKVIGMTKNNAEQSIAFQDTLWGKAGFTGDYQHLSFKTGRVWEIPQTSQLPNLQQDLWNWFQRFML